MSTSSISSSPLSPYTVGTVVPSENSSTLSPVSLPPSASPCQDSLCDEPIGPRTSSPMVHSESLGEQSSSSLASITPFHSLPPLSRDSISSAPHLMQINLDEAQTIPTSSPLLRPSSGRLVGGD